MCKDQLRGIYHNESGYNLLHCLYHKSLITQDDTRACLKI